MLTKLQAIDAREFHEARPGWKPGSRKSRCITWRRNGGTQTWVTRPDEWRIPVKYGLRDTGNIWHHDASAFYVPEECPYCRGDA